MGSRYEHDEEARKASGFSESTYATIFDRLERESSEVRPCLCVLEYLVQILSPGFASHTTSTQGKRLFIKDIIHYLLPPNAKPAQIAPSLLSKKRGIGTQANGVAKEVASDLRAVHPFPYGSRAEPGNPTVIPGELLRQFHYTFLIRDPHFSIPSYYRCTIPPLDKVTGFFEFYPSEAGYDEVRRMFDYLVASGLVGPSFAAGNESGRISDGVKGINGTNGADAVVETPDICVIDADDLLDYPQEMIEAYCNTVGLEYKADMLHWEDDENQKRAKVAFEKWKGFHEDAIDSTELRARTHVSTSL